MIQKSNTCAGLISAFCSSIKGFTLIELLVVVIIIAVLTAVAVPMYKHAVLKSQFSELFPLGKALSESNETYYLANGEYSTSPQELDVTLPEGDIQVTLGNEIQRMYVQLTRSGSNNNLVFYQAQSPNYPGEIHCEAKKTDADANWLCEKGLSGTPLGEVKNGYKVYSLADNPNGTLARTYYNLSSWAFSQEGDVCVGTTWGGCASGSRYTNHNECEAYASHACGGNSQYSNYSVCHANHTSDACYWTIYSNYSECHGNATGGCRGVKMSDHSVCYGDVAGSCNTACDGSSCNPGWYQSHYSIYSDSSSCVGGAANTCTGSRFNTNSTCVANAVGACTGATYDETSYCSGSYCPSGAASSTAGKVWYRGEGEDWPDTRASELVDVPQEIPSGD